MTVSVTKIGQDTSVKIIYDDTSIDSSKNIEFFHTNNIKISDPEEFKTHIFKLLEYIKTQ